MEGFLEISSSNYLFSSVKNFEKFALRKCRENCLNCFENCDIFLFEEGLQQHTLKGENPSAGASFLFSFFDDSSENIFLFGEQFRHTLKMEINPSIGTALLSFSLLKLEFSFSYYLGNVSNTPLGENPSGNVSPLFFQFIFFDGAVSTHPKRRNPSETAPFSFFQLLFYFFFFGKIGKFCKGAKK